MSCAFCGRPLRELANIGETRPAELLAAVRDCATCSARAQSLVGALDALARAEPEGDEAARKKNVQAVLARVASAKPGVAAKATPKVSRVLVPVFALAAAFALVVVLRGRHEKNPSATYVLHGELALSTRTLEKDSPVPPDAVLTAKSETVEIRLSDGSEILAHRGAVFQSRPDGARVRVERGELAFHVIQRSTVAFVVETDEADLRVVGARFVVTRTQGRTKVDVSEGIVELTSKIGPEGTRQIAAGESLDTRTDQVDAAPSVDAGKDDASAASNAGDSDQDASPASPKGVRPSDIRARLRAGKVSEARALLRTAHERSLIDPAELGVLEAEIALAEKRHEDAIAIYLRVSRSYPKSRQAEEALFAAAQLSIDRGQRARGRQLLAQYMETYPRGRFVNEAERLLDVTSGNPP